MQHRLNLVDAPFRRRGDAILRRNDVEVGIGVLVVVWFGRRDQVLTTRASTPYSDLAFSAGRR